MPNLQVRLPTTRQPPAPVNVIDLQIDGIMSPPFGSLYSHYLIREHVLLLEETLCSTSVCQIL
jgi:hypothetical protein